MSQNSIFICYRRTDSGWAGRLEDELKERFPDGAVFRDRGIPAGVPWRQHIEGVLDACQVMLVLIGPSWTTSGGRGDVARLWEDDDIVSHEIARALQRPDVQVIPILFDGAQMPSAAQLPIGIQALGERHAHELSDLRWDYDMKVLGDNLARFVDEDRGPRPDAGGDPRRALTMAAVAGIAGLIAWPVADTSAWPSPARSDPFTSDWVTVTLQRLAGIAAHRAILWALIFALTLGAGYFALRRTRAGAPAGVLIGLTSGAIAGAIGGVVYVLLKEAARHGAPELLSEQVLNGIGVAVTGVLLAGRFASFGGAQGVSYRAVGLVAGLVAGVLGGMLTESGMTSLGWAVQAVVLIGALSALLAAPSFAQPAPAIRAAGG